MRLIFKFLDVLSIVAVVGTVSASAKIDEKFRTEEHNPISDFMYCADPTAVEYDGRLYVYGTNDQQEFEANKAGTDNSYGKIRSLVMFSTDDMVNWTYHGLIEMPKIASWIGTSWAPSIVSRVEKDGQTHFYLYFLNSGYAVAVLTSTSPVGPWKSPLGSNLINGFDPGVAIDDKGVGWLSFGGQGSTPSVVQLGSDMISIKGKPVEINAPFHNEANELNFINGVMVYTYNTDWSDHTPWVYTVAKPTACSMCYMTSSNPTDSDSWMFRGYYFKTPGDYLNFGWGNNHTHLHKFQGNWYLIYHNQMLQEQNDALGGYRSIAVDKIKVSEALLKINECTATRKGVNQLKDMDPYVLQQAETAFATKNVTFKSDSKTPGNMYYSGMYGKTGIIKVSRVNLSDGADSLRLRVWGSGSIEVREKSEDGRLIASLVDYTNSTKDVVTVPVDSLYRGRPNLLFVCKGGIKFDTWQFVQCQQSTVVGPVSKDAVSSSDGLLYDLNGNVVEPFSAVKGIVIRNGRKYLQ